jgi:hypothetical protein
LQQACNRLATGLDDFKQSGIDRELETGRAISKSKRKEPICALNPRKKAHSANREVDPMAEKPY